MKKNIILFSFVILSLFIYLNVLAESALLKVVVPLKYGDASDFSDYSDGVAVASKGFTTKKAYVKLIRSNREIYQVPDGGFSDDISGKWDCGNLGMMTLRKNGTNRYRGNYTFKRGRVTGKLRNSIFKGEWMQKKRRGNFEFKTSIERKEKCPTHLRGNWNYRGDSNWRGKWTCVKK